MEKDNKTFYVTISRQFGSGGAEIGSKVATKLGVRCYDKSISEMTSAVTGVAKKIVVSSEEQVANTFWYSGFLGGESATYDKVNGAHAKVIEKLAKKGSCVFVGRCASHVLKDYENVIRIFICAPIEIRRKRVSEGYKITPVEAGKLIAKNDKARSAYYKKYTGKEWGKAENYDLIINTRIGVNRSAKVIADFVKEFLKNK